MRANEFEPCLESAVGEVLEAMCFLSTAGEDPSLGEELGADWVAMQLEFQGKASGAFGVCAPLCTARLIAANFLGEEEAELTDSQAVEVIGEITNMACGTLLARMETKEAFTLSPPLRENVGASRKASPDRLRRTFSLDEGTLHVWLEIGARS